MPYPSPLGPWHDTLKGFVLSAPAVRWASCRLVRSGRASWQPVQRGLSMSDVPSSHPAGRFTGLAEVYAAGRPDYPEAAVEFIVAHCGLTANSLLVDVGCGTGISSRQFAARGLRVVGVEPNDDMRRRAAAGPTPPG